jgi:hypothetical protein
MRSILLRLAALALLAAAAGCAAGPLAVDPDTADARENLARLLTNRAIRAFYEGNARAAAVAVDLALEVAPIDAARDLQAHLNDGTARYRPRLLAYTGDPGLPEARAQTGRVVRIILYPVWGFPLDLVECVYKGIFVIPVLGDVVELGVLGAGIACLALTGSSDNSAEDDKNLVIGGAACVGAAVVPPFALSGLGGIVYQDRFLARWDEWKLTLTWWWGGDHDPLASAFFSNFQRIDGGEADDDRLRDARAAAEAERERPLEIRNREVAEWNGAIATGANPFVPVPPPGPK